MSDSEENSLKIGQDYSSSESSSEDSSFEFIADMSYERLKNELKKIKHSVKLNLRNYFVQRKFDDIYFVTPLA